MREEQPCSHSRIKREHRSRADNSSNSNSSSRNHPTPLAATLEVLTTRSQLLKTLLRQQYAAAEPTAAATTAARYTTVRRFVRSEAALRNTRIAATTAAAAASIRIALRKQCRIHTGSSKSTSVQLVWHTTEQQLVRIFRYVGFPQQQQQQQQPQPQQQGQQQSSQPNTFGQGGLGFNSSSPAPFSSQQNQSFGSPFHQQQQHNAQQHQPTGTQFGTPQSSQHQHFQQQQQQQQQQQAIEQQRFNLEQQSQNMSYIPGYLSRTKVVKPYKLPSRQAEPTSPEAVQDADSSIAFGTPASKSGKEESTPSSKGQPSPVGRFSSSFFNDRREDASFSRAAQSVRVPWGEAREHLWCWWASWRSSIGDTGTHVIRSRASATPARKSSMDSPARSVRPTRHLLPLPHPSTWRTAQWTKKMTMMRRLRSDSRMRHLLLLSPLS